nr:MAG TPA: hypothetical protein [Caudoviricetes sp.]
MIALLREVDFYQTKCNARKILKNYRNYSTRSGWHDSAIERSRFLSN